jgi:hypothetical protein
VDRHVLAADTIERAIIKVSLDCLPLQRLKARPPINLILVINCSSSTQGDRIVQAWRAALELVRRLDRNDIISLSAYDSDVGYLFRRSVSDKCEGWKPPSAA